MKTTLLHVDSLVKGYRLGQQSIEVLRGLSLHVGRGEMVAIMGPSGSGKTTLLNCICGIDNPQSGTVTVAGQKVDYDDERACTLLRRRRIGQVFQFFNLIPTLTVAENVGLPLLIDRDVRHKDGTRVSEMLTLVGMSERRDHLPFQLSGGEMQLVSIARALVHRPDLLLADEPTGNVNPRVGRSIMLILRDTARREGSGVLMVTHSPEHAAWADRVCFLKDGMIASELAHGGQSDAPAPIHERLLALGI
jgi:putative ABC transport system ATP-binding protein